METATKPIKENHKEVLNSKKEVWTPKVGYSVEPVQPVIRSVELDRGNMQKHIIYDITKHIYKTVKNSETKGGNGRKYDHTKITQEKETHILKMVDINNYEKEKLLTSIDNEVSKVDLTTIKSNEDILDFACSEPVSNTERMRRAVALCKVVNKKLEEKWFEEKKRRKTLDKKEQNELNRERNFAQRCKITTEDIARYR